MDALCIRTQQLQVSFNSYLKAKLGMYADEIKIQEFGKVLFSIKTRPFDCGSIETLCHPVFDEERLRHISEPCRILELKNLYALLYNMTGFLNISRNDAAVILKLCFPNVFRNTSIISINKSLSRYKMIGKDCSMKIPYLKSSNAMYFERMLNKYNQ